MEMVNKSKVIPGDSRVPDDLEGRFVAACQVVHDEQQARQVVFTGDRCGWTFGRLDFGFVDLWAPIVDAPIASSYTIRNDVLSRAVKSLGDQGAIKVAIGKNRMVRNG